MKRRTLLLGCMIVLSVVGLSSCTSNDVKRGPAQPGGRPALEAQQALPDLAAAAKELGVSEKTLTDALGDSKQGPPDLAAAAEVLGVTKDELSKALGVPAGLGK